MSTPPVSSSPGAMHSLPAQRSVKIGSANIVCYDPDQKAKTETAIAGGAEVGNLKLFGPHIHTIDPEIGDASPTSILTLMEGVVDALPGRKLSPFKDVIDLLDRGDPTETKEWATRASKEGEGDTLELYAVNVKNSLTALGLPSVPPIETVHVNYGIDEHEKLAVMDVFRKAVQEHSHDKIHVVIVNCDQALAINGATKPTPLIEAGDFGGNYCIVGGYDPKTDKVLLLDQDKADGPDGNTPAKSEGIYWVPLEGLVAAMHTYDSDAEMNRGYLTFSIDTKVK